MIWLVFAAMSALALIILVRPLLRAGRHDAARPDYDLAVYRRQLAELEAEVRRGVIAGAAAEEARREIERRILGLPANEAAPPTVASWRWPAALVVVVGVPLATVLLYTHLGNPTVPGAPWAEPAARSVPATADVPELVAQLAERMRLNPDDPRGWLLLGRSYMGLGRYVDAANAYGEALARDADDNEARIGLAEALTLAAEGTVTPAAKALFEAALEREAAHPRTRYYLGLAAWQAGQPQAAYDRWLALAKAAPTDAPWLPLVVDRLGRVAQELGIDLVMELPAELPRPDGLQGPSGPSAEDRRAAAEMSAEDRQAFIAGMVARLAARLETSPEDFDGWMRLGQSYRVLGDDQAAAEAFSKAVRLRPDDPVPLAAEARALLEGGDPKAPPPPAAIAAYRRLLRLRPDNPEALWFTGFADARAGRVAAAVSAWDRLLPQLNPESNEYKSLAAELQKARSRLKK